MMIDAGVAETPDLTAALSDRSSSVRSVAQTYLRKTDIDPTAIYRSQLAGSPSAGDVLGLGETGTEGDADLIASWLESEDARLRRSALIATVALLDQGAVRTAVAMLCDQSPRVVGTAMRLISRRRVPEDLVEGLERQAVSSAPQDRRRAVILLRASSWRWLLAILRNLPDAESDMARFLASELAEWRRRSANVSAGPSASQAVEIRERLGAVDDETSRAIQFVLRTSVQPD
jgi:HEAT repeat protein